MANGRQSTHTLSSSDRPATAAPDGHGGSMIFPGPLRPPGGCRSHISPHHQSLQQQQPAAVEHPPG